MLRTEEVTIKFGGLTAVNKASVEVKEGKITALIGPNGAGKTTLFNCISGVYTPNEGSVILDDKHIEGLPGYKINEMGVTRTYQVINLFGSMSVIENVLVGMHTNLHQSFWDSLIHTPRQRKEDNEAYEKAYEWLKFVGLEAKADYRADMLPYGEQRLLEIVRGLASNPKYILLDEPAAGMNSTEKVALDQILKKILSIGVTILIIEHDMKLVMNVADYIYVLEHGSVLAEGLPIEIQKNQAVIDAYLGGDE